MAIFKNDTQNSRQSETIIGSSVKVEGNFVGEGNVIIEGQLQGTLKTKNNVNIGPTAKVKANIEAQDVFLAGELHGNIKALGKLQIMSSAKIFGNFETQSLTVEAGASINGKCTMGSEALTSEKIEKVK